MSTITAVIPAKNEEHNIKRCIESVKWCDRVIVMFVGDDKTGKIATQLGAEVFVMNKTQKDDFVALQKNINWAIDNAKTDWVLRIDADEEVTPELQKEIKEVIKQQIDIVAYGIRRNQFFWGGFLKGGDWAYDCLIRLFKTKHARYEPIVEVHEQFKVNGPTGRLHAKLNHYSHPTLADARRKFQAYTDVQIKDMQESLPHAFFNILTQPPYIFFRWLIWHGGYKDGIRGVVAAIYRGWYEFLLYKKYIRYLLTKESSSISHT